MGMYEADAKEKGIPFFTLTVPLADVDRALLDGEAEGFARVHLRKGSDTILGATITAGLGLSAIGKTIHPYPTQGEVIKKLGDAYSRSRLTPTVIKILSKWLAWQRS